MNNLITIAALLALPYTLAHAQTDASKKAASRPSAIEQEFIRLYKGWDEALVKVDLEFLDRIVATECIFTGADGTTISKGEVMADLKSGKDVISAAATDEFKITVIGDTAVVNNRWIAKEIYKNKDMSGQSRYTETWVKRDGRWQVVASHGSKIDNTEQELLSLEQQISQAYVKGDIPFLERLFASDYTFIQGDGRTNTRAQELDKLRKKELIFDSVDFHEGQVKTFGDFAIVTGRVTFSGKSKDGAINGNEQITDVLVRREGRWQLLTSQATPIKATKP